MTKLVLPADPNELTAGTLPGAEPGETKERFSLSKAVLASVRNDWRSAGFEREVLTEYAKQQSLVDAEGGFSVPEMYLSELLDQLYSSGVALRLGARIIPATGSPFHVPRLASNAQWPEWVGENASFTPGDAVFEQIEAVPYHVGGLVVASNSLMENSSPTGDALFGQMLGSAVASAIDTAIFAGSGAGGQPTGLLGQGIPGAAFGAPMVAAIRNANAWGPSMGWAMSPDKATATGGPAEPGTPETAAVTYFHNARWETTTALTGTVANASILGNWNDCWVIRWKDITIRTSDAGPGFASDQSYVRAVARIDVHAARLASFVAQNA
jgi:hypothetical protein